MTQSKTKTKVIPIRLTESEYKIIQNKAKKNGLNASAFMRMSSLKYE